jgi:hypothetical protein
MVIGGGAENCLGAADTGAPWAAGEAAAAGADDLGSGLSALESCAADAGVLAGLVAAGAGAVDGAAFWQPATSTTSSAQIPRRMTWAV